MLIRRFWRNCGYRGKKWGTEPLDAFWVEATQEEAENGVFPRLQPTTIMESRELAERFKEVAEQMGNPPGHFAFWSPGI